jgi:hypothetical protein
MRRNPVAEIVRSSGSRTKSTNGADLATPRKTPSVGEVSKRDKERNAAPYVLLAPIERVIALKSWLMFDADCRRFYSTTATPTTPLADAAITLLAASKFRNAGQVCVSPTRFLVQKQVYERFVAGFAAAANAIRVGDGLDERTTMGPLANPRRVQTMDDLVHDAVDHGAELVTGGRRIGENGNFYAPTVLIAGCRSRRE